MLQAYRTETTLTQDGTLVLEHLPFYAGDAVEVIVLAEMPARLTEDRYALRGTVIEYIDPFGPAVAEADWEVLQ